MTKGDIEKRTRSKVIVAMSSMLLSFLNCHEVCAEDAASLYSQKCAGCHTIGGGNSVGPDLAASTKWNASDLSKSIKKMEKNVGPLSTTEINNLVEFLKGKGSVAQAPSTSGPSTPTSTAEVPAVQDQAGTADGATGTAPEAIQGQPTPAAAFPAPGAGAPEPVTLAEPASAARGARLFSGSEALGNGGLSCIACHSVDGVGGTMAADLIEIYKKMAPQALATACEKTPFKIMKTAYKDHPVDHQEALDLAAYLTSLKDPHEKPTEIPVTLIAFLFAGAVLAIIALGYRGRKGSARAKLHRRK